MSIRQKYDSLDPSMRFSSAACWGRSSTTRNPKYLHGNNTLHRRPPLPEQMHIMLNHAVTVCVPL